MSGSKETVTRLGTDEMCKCLSRLRYATEVEKMFDKVAEDGRTRIRKGIESV